MRRRARVTSSAESSWVRGWNTAPPGRVRRPSMLATAPPRRAGLSGPASRLTTPYQCSERGRTLLAERGDALCELLGRHHRAEEDLGFCDRLGHPPVQVQVQLSL